VDGSGNAYVTGRLKLNASDDEWVTIKFSGEGVPLWTNYYNEPGNSADVPNAVAVDGSGNVYATGYSTGIGTDRDCTTIAYSSAGLALWTNRYNGPKTNSDDSAYAVAVDRGNNAYVTGYSWADGSWSDYLTIGYSSTGLALWTNRYNGPASGDDSATAVAVDGLGDVYVTGYSPGSGSGNDFATIKYGPPPVINNTVQQGSNLVFGGTGGRPDGTYYVLASTNLATQMTNWVGVATNTFGVDGSFSVTNAVEPATRRQFFRLQVP
jgi:hypothetical protein